MQIGYSDKVTLTTLPSVNEINKVTAGNMNEIKNVVNNNQAEVGDITTLNTTNKTSVVNAVNEVNTKLQDTGWITAELFEGFSSGLASAGTFMYRRIGNIVYLKGSAKGFGEAPNNACAQLPEGFRPATRIDFYASESGNYIAKFQVASSGYVSYLGGTRGSVSSTQWFNMCTSYITDEDFPS